MSYQSCIWCGDLVTTCTMSRCITNGFVHLGSRLHTCRTEQWSAMWALPRFPMLAKGDQRVT